MAPVVKGAIVLALAVGLLTAVFALTGLHQNPIVGGLLGLVVVIGLNVAVVIWVLRQTAADNGYGKQLVQGLLLGAVGGALVFVVSWVMMSFVFPDYLPETTQASIDFLEQSGMPEEALKAKIASLESTTVTGQCFTGLIGTFVTSLVVGAIAAIFQRRK